MPNYLTHRKSWILLAAMAAIVAVLVGSLVSFQSTSAAADTVEWADWTSFTGGGDDTSGGTSGALGTASGTLGSASLSYSGEIFADVIQVDGTGTDVWEHPIFGEEAYESNTVHNGPPGKDIIGMIGGGGANANTQTITFSPPVLDPFMALNSMGQHNITLTYKFTTAFTLLSSGFGHFSPNNATPGTLTVSGNDLSGKEGEIGWKKRTPKSDKIERRRCQYESVPQGRYTREFRQEAVKLVTEERLSLPEAARRLSLAPSTLGYWVKAQRAGKLGDVGKTYRPLTEVEMDLARTKKELAEVRWSGTY